MKRRWNVRIWAGLAVVAGAMFTWQPAVMDVLPSTRRVPWLTLALAAVGLALIVVGWRLARRRPDVYRGRIAAPVALTLAAAITALFGWVSLVHVRDLPVSAGAPQVGRPAPDFTLPDQDDRPVTLSRQFVASDTGAAPAKAVLLIFYRGYW